MAEINETNWMNYSDGGVYIIGTDTTDKIDLRKYQYPSFILGAGGDDIIYGTNHFNFTFGDLEYTPYYVNDNYNNVSGSDAIYGGNLADFIQGGRGNDIINTGGGINVIEFKSGDGQDYVYNSNGKDYLYFIDTNTNNFTYKKQGDDLVINYTKEDSVTLINYFKYGTKSSIKGIADLNTNLAAIENLFYEYYNNNIKEKYAVSRLNLILPQISQPIMNVLLYNLILDVNLPQKSKFKGSIFSENIVGSDFDDTIDAFEGNDFILGGKGNDILSGGKGNDTFVFNMGDGIDIIKDAKFEDTLNFNLNKNQLKFIRNGNDLEITNTLNTTDKITIKNHFRNTNAIDRVVSNDETFSLQNVPLIVKGKGKLIGGHLNDEIYGDEKSANTITGGKGNDTINSGGGKNTIVFNTGDGNDILVSGKGTDTLVFNSNITIQENLNDVIINYGNNDSVTIQNYKAGHSAQYVKVGKNKAESLSNYLSYISGTNGNDKIYVKPTATEINLGGGSDTVIFDNNSLIRDKEGYYYLNDITITSSADITNGKTTNTDTLIFKNNSPAADNMGLFKINNNLEIWAGGSIIYKNYFNGTTPNLVIQDKFNKKYSIINNANQFTKSGNYFAFLDSAQNVNFSSGNNIVYIDNNLKNNFNYNGGYTKIDNTGVSNDTYNVNSFGAKTALEIYDDGGSDTIIINANSSDLRLVFDTLDEIYKLCIVHKSSLNANKLGKIIDDDTFGTTGGGIYLGSNGSEFNSKSTKIATKDHPEGLNISAWMNAINEQVSGFYAHHNYDGLDDVFGLMDNHSYNMNDAKEITALYNVEYNNII